MKFLLLALGSYGDVLPMIGIGKQLSSEGHDVQILVNDYFAAAVKEAGLPRVFGGTVEEYLRLANHPDLFNRSTGPAFVANALLDWIEPLFYVVKGAMEDDRIVTGGLLSMGARVAQEVTGKPYVAIHLAPVDFWSVESPPRFPVSFTFPGEPKFLVRASFNFISKLADKDVAPRLNEFRAKFGLKPVKNIWSEWIHSPYKNLCMFPDWFAQPQSDWPAYIETTNFPLFEGVSSFETSKELDDFISNGEKPILFTGGTAFVYGQVFFNIAAEAVKKLKTRAIFVSTLTEKMDTNFGPDIFVCKHAQFREVLPRCSVFVHHGGIGSTARGIASGIPQLLKPMAFDQFDNAMRIEKLGIGKTLPHDKWNVERVYKTLSDLLSNPKFQQAAEEKAELIKKIDGIKLACASLTSDSR